MALTTTVKPHDGVAEGNGEIAQVREGHREQQNQPQHACAEERDNGWLHGVSNAPHHRRQNLRR